MCGSAPPPPPFPATANPPHSPLPHSSHRFQARNPPPLAAVLKEDIRTLIPSHSSPTAGLSQTRDSLCCRNSLALCCQLPPSCPPRTTFSRTAVINKANESASPSSRLRYGGAVLIFSCRCPFFSCFFFSFQCSNYGV